MNFLPFLLKLFLAAALWVFLSALVVVAAAAALVSAALLSLSKGFRKFILALFLRGFLFCLSWSCTFLCLGLTMDWTSVEFTSLAKLAFCKRGLSKTYPFFPTPGVVKVPKMWLSLSKAGLVQTMSLPR